jgi:hypothetical protein
MVAPAVSLNPQGPYNFEAMAPSEDGLPGEAGPPPLTRSTPLLKP